MEICRLTGFVIFVSLLSEVSLAMSQHDTSNQPISVSVPWTEVGFFVVLLLDVVAVVALLVVIKYRKNRNTGVSLQKALISKPEVKTPIYKGPAVYQELKMDKRFHEYNAVSQIEEIDQHFKPTNASSDSLYDSISETNFLNHS